MSEQNPHVEDLAANGFEPSHDDIARLAYALWEQRGRSHGADELDWFAAEAQLRNQKTASAAA